MLEKLARRFLGSHLTNVGSVSARVRCENLSNELALNRAICKILTTFNRKLLYISESRAQRSYNLDCI